MRKKHGKGHQVKALLKKIEKLETQVGQLRLDARHDQLTGLANQANFAEHFRFEIASARRHKEQIAVHVMDLNKFKKVNDSHGHEFADRLLVAVAERFRGLIRRDNDIVARRSGDEFWAMATGIKEESHAAKFSGIITEAFKAPFVIEKKRICVSMSIGIRLVDPKTESALDFRTLMKDADLAMYEAKRKHLPCYLYKEKNGEKN